MQYCLSFRSFSIESLESLQSIALLCFRSEANRTHLIRLLVAAGTLYNNCRYKNSVFPTGVDRGELVANRKYCAASVSCLLSHSILDRFRSEHCHREVIGVSEATSRVECVCVCVCGIPLDNGCSKQRNGERPQRNESIDTHKKINTKSHRKSSETNICICLLVALPRVEEFAFRISRRFDGDAGSCKHHSMRVKLVNSFSRRHDQELNAFALQGVPCHTSPDQFSFGRVQCDHQFTEILIDSAGIGGRPMAN